MSTSNARLRPGRAAQMAMLLTVLCASVAMLGAAAYAKGTSNPRATSARLQLRVALADRAAAARAAASSSRRLKRCLHNHPHHPRRCRKARRAARRAQLRLAQARRRATRLAHASRHQTTKKAPAPSGETVSPTSSPTPTSSTTSEPALPSSLVEPFVKGIDTNLQGWGSQGPQVASEMSTLGVKWAREDLAWSVVEAEKGVFNWSSFDKLVAEAKEYGLTILPIVGYAPSWASPADAADYAAFVQAAVQRYGPGTSANLQWWELWNEPYFAYAWSGKTPEPEAYARDAMAAAQAAKSVSPSVKLLLSADFQDSAQTGGSSPWETTWIDDMFAAVPTLGSWVDGVSVHPYGDDPALPLAELGGWKDAFGAWAFQRIDTIRSKFLAHEVNLPFWITEAGWSTAEVSEAVQAQNYADLAPQIAARPWIRALFPYCLREDSPTATRESAFGLLKYGSWEPKTAFYKLQESIKTLT